MKLKRLAAVYAIFMGISMIGLWAMFYFNGQIPELKTKPIEIGLHLLAELTTAILLMVSGIGMLTEKGWAYSIYMFATGMLVYTMIQSPGYFLQSGDIPIVIMFGVFIILAIILVTSLLVKRDNFDI